MSAFIVGGNAGGDGTSLYMTEGLRHNHHSPSFGPFEAKKYEGPALLFAPSPLGPGYATISRQPDSSASLDLILATYQGNPSLKSSLETSSGRYASSSRLPPYLSTHVDKGCYH